MRYGSVCSGIEAATVAWHPLGWSPAFFSEIEAAPRAVLSRFIIPKPDPLVDAFASIGTIEPKYAADNLRAAIEARGGKIIFNEE